MRILSRLAATKTRRRIVVLVLGYLGTLLLLAAGGGVWVSHPAGAAAVSGILYALEVGSFVGASCTLGVPKRAAGVYLTLGVASVITGLVVLAIDVQGLPVPQRAALVCAAGILFLAASLLAFRDANRAMLPRGSDSHDGTK
jgi:hypothetical protein